jgi:glycosyltransferase involved in cell wall biosynthesis
MLQDAVRSVELQSIKTELVVVDDASTDGTAGWLAGKHVNTVRLLERSERSTARNAGLTAVNASAVLFLDDDDILRPRGLARLRAALDRRSDAVAAVGAAVAFDSSGIRTGRQYFHPRKPLTIRVRREALIGWSAITGATLWRREAVERAGRWDSRWSWAEDWDLWLRASRIGGVTFIPQDVVCYRLHPEQTIARLEQRERRTIGREIRTAYLASLDARERADAQRYLTFLGRGPAAVLSAYSVRDFERAWRTWLGLAQGAPWLLGSPIFGDSMLALGGKIAIGRLAGAPFIERISAIRRHLR